MADAPVIRIRKLLRLAESSNPHEAARAAEQAKALMERHGVTADDVAEHIIEEIDDQRDAYREFLAHLTASLCQCSVMFRRAGIGFKGMPEAVRKAVVFYRAAMDEVAQAPLPQAYAPWLEEAAREVWRFYWWDGFASAVYERRGARPVKAPVQAPVAAVQVAEDPRAGEAGEAVLQHVAASFSKLDYNTDPHWLKREARTAGWNAGIRVCDGNTIKRLTADVRH